MLLAMFRLLGTPTVHMWPGVELLPHYSPLFPKWPTQKLIKEARALEGSAGADLLKVRLLLFFLPLFLLSSFLLPRFLCSLFLLPLFLLPFLLSVLTPSSSACAHVHAQRMLTYDPAARISAKAALQHPYFSEA